MKINNLITTFVDYSSVSSSYNSARNTVGLELFHKHFKNFNRILDSGCGTGMYVQKIEPYYKDIYGIDNNEKMLELLKDKNLKNVKISLESCFDTKFKDNFFDGIMSNQVIQHLESKENINKFIKESVRVLRKNGKLIISTRNKLPNYTDLYWYTDFAPKAVEKMEKKVPDETIINELLRKNNLDVIDVVKPEDTFMNMCHYLNYDGIFDESWRKGESIWSLVDDIELENIQLNIKNMMNNGTLIDYINEKEKLRKLYGQSVFFIAKKR